MFRVNSHICSIRSYGKTSSLLEQIPIGVVLKGIFAIPLQPARIGVIEIIFGDRETLGNGLGLPVANAVIEIVFLMISKLIENPDQILSMVDELGRLGDIRFKLSGPVVKHT